MGTDFIYKECVYAHRYHRTCPCLVICNILSHLTLSNVAYLSIQQMISPVVAWVVGMWTVVWTWIGHAGGRARRNTRARGGHGGQPAAAYRRKGFINLCQNSWWPL